MDSLPSAMQKRLYWSRCSLGCWVTWVQKPRIRWGATGPSVCNGDAAFMLNYFDCVLSISRKMIMRKSHTKLHATHANEHVNSRPISLARLTSCLQRTHPLL